MVPTALNGRCPESGLQYEWQMLWPAPPCCDRSSSVLLRVFQRLFDRRMDKTESCPYGGCNQMQWFWTSVIRNWSPCMVREHRSFECVLQYASKLGVWPTTTQLLDFIENIRMYHNVVVITGSSHRQYCHQFWYPLHCPQCVVVAVPSPCPWAFP
jgi:hypothetical protein